MPVTWLGQPSTRHFQVVFEPHRQAGEVENAQRHAGAFEDLLIAAAAFMHLVLAATHVDQRQYRQHRQAQAQQAFADQRRQQFLEHLALVEQAAQLPVAVGQRRDQYAVGFIIRLQYRRTRTDVVVAADDTVVLAVLDDPGWAEFLPGLARQTLEQTRVQAQRPVAVGLAAGLTQQQVHHRTVIVVGEVIGLGPVAAPDQLAEVLGVVAVGGAVGDEIALGVEQGKALDGRQGQTQFVEQLPLLLGGLGFLENRQQVGCDLRIELHVQADVIGQLGAVVDAVLALDLAGLLELVDQLPEQHREHEQHQNRQHADRKSVGTHNGVRARAMAGWRCSNCDPAVGLDWRDVHYKPDARRAASMP